MGHTWYYIENNKRIGPIDEQSFINLLSSQLVTDESYVWRKGLETWTQAYNVPELMEFLKQESLPKTSNNNIIEKSWFAISPTERCFFMRQEEGSTFFGPYSLTMLKELKKSNRLNDTSWIFAPHMPQWVLIGAIPSYEEIFGDVAPSRLPSQKLDLFGTILVSFQGKEQSPEQGIVQDLTLGGMQVITKAHSFPPKTEVIFTLRPLFQTPPLTLKAEIVRKLQENSGVFVRFTELDEALLQQLQRYIDLSS